MIDDSESMQRFARVELGDADESTLLRFHHLLEREGLTEGVFEVVKDLLAEKRLMLRSDTSVDGTIIAAPSSTKNETKSRDPEMKQLWGFTRTRYRGIAKNLARAQTMFALANLYAVRHRLRPPQASAAL